MKKISDKKLFDGQWISLYETVFENRRGEQIVWECIRRKKSAVGVVAVAELKPSRRFILIKQFRPALNGYVLSFPAGMSQGDPQHALVELKEETGYTGRIVDVSPLLKASFGLINDSVYVVAMEVDEFDPQNQNPQQELESAEDITVVLVKREEARDFLIREQKAGTFIASNLWHMFGVGI